MSGNAQADATGNRCHSQGFSNELPRPIPEVVTPGRSRASPHGFAAGVCLLLRNEMGRPAKTIRQHLLSGTVPQGKQEFKVSLYEGGRPKIPKHLSPAARREFKRGVQLLEQRGTITEGDLATLAVYAETLARWIAAKEQLGDQLMITTTIKDTHGEPVIVQRLNPLLKVVQACEGRLLALAKNLGLTPLDRDKVKPTRANPDLEIVPGSIAETHPELLAKVLKQHEEMKRNGPN